MAQASIQIHETEGFALIEVGGEVRGQDIVQAAHTLRKDPRWRQHFNVIWDGRKVTSLLLEPNDLTEMVEAKAETTVGKEVTIAVRSLDVEMAKLCALLLRVRGLEASVVGTLEGALAELDLEELPQS